MSLQLTPPSPQASARSWTTVVVAVVGTCLALAVLVIAFALPAAHSGPHGVPIGIVGTQAQTDAFSAKAAGFSVHRYRSQSDARAAILHRDIYGAIALDSPAQIDVLVATAASPPAAALVQAIGQQMSAAAHLPAHLDDVRAFPGRDPKGTGLAAGALPLALGGWIGAMVIMLLVPSPSGRIGGAVGFAVLGGFTVVATLQYVIGTFDGNFWLTSLAGMFGIAATCFIVLGLRELLGGPGLGVAAVLLVLLGNGLSGLASGPEFLPRPWGSIGQLLPPGATGTLMRDVTFFDGHGAAKSVITLTGYLIAGIALYAIALLRARRAGTVDVDRIEFDHQPRRPSHPVPPQNPHPAPPQNPPPVRPQWTPGTAVTEPLGGSYQQAPAPRAVPRRIPPAPQHTRTNAEPWRPPNRPDGPTTFGPR